MSEIRRKILDLLVEERRNEYGRRRVFWTSEIARRIGHSVSVVAMDLFDLEKDGLVEGKGQGSYQRWWINDGVEIKEEDKVAYRER